MTGLALLVACLQTTLDADAGFQGTVFPDSWVRFSATLAYEGESLDAELRITLKAYTAEPVVYKRPLRLVRKARMRLGYDLYLTGAEYLAEIELVAPGKNVRPSTINLNFIHQEGSRLLAIGTPPPFVVEAMGKKPPVNLVRLPADQLPSTSLSLLSVDTILIPEPITLDPGQETALQEWVAQGGKLIFGAGRSTQLRQNPFWRGWCPLATPELGTLSARGKESDLPLTIVRGNLLRGRASLSVAGEPAVIRFPEGVGEIVFLPIVLEQLNLVRILPATTLLAEVLNLPPPPKEDLTPRRGFMPRQSQAWELQGKRIVSTQTTSEFLRRVLPSAFSLRPGALALGVAAVAIYIILIGPFEYLRLRRKGQLQTGWRSFAFLVVLFGGLVILWGSLVSPQRSRLLLITLLDEKRVHTFAVLRPARGDVFEIESGGPITLLPPPRPFGSIDPPEGMTLSGRLPSGLRLPTPASAPRLMLASREIQPDEGAISAQWTGTGRKSLEVKNSAGFPLKECWAVSKESVWSLGEIGAGSTRRIDLNNPAPMASWALQQLDHLTTGRAYGQFETMWERMSPSRYGLLLSIHEAFYDAWELNRKQSRNLLLEKGIDWSPALAREEVLLLCSFDKNVSALLSKPEIPAEVFGWARIRVREATR
jgi:hypothetical protein